MTYNIGDLIQTEYGGTISIGVIVGTKLNLNGYNVDIQWLDKDNEGHISKGYSTHFLDSYATVVNCGPIQNP